VIMYKIIQTVHHDFGRESYCTWYDSANDFQQALDRCHMLNVDRAEKNQRKDSIPVTYHVEYHTTEWED